MPKLQPFWTVSFTAPQAVAPNLADAFADDAVALTVMAPPRKDTATVEALFDAPPSIGNLTARINVQAMMLGIAAPKLKITEIPSLDWLQKVAEDFPPLPIARWVVYGAQHRAAALRQVTNARRVLQIDATSAFGTGEHPTTRGCLMMLDRLLKSSKPRRILDIGCGSGILALAYARSSAGHAVAIDCDAQSVEIAQSNMRINGVTRQVRVLKGFGYRPPSVRHNAPYDLIMANIFARPLSQMAKDLKRSLHPNGKAILSGILNHQANQVLSAHRMQKIYLTRRIRIGEWSVLLLRQRAQ